MVEEHPPVVLTPPFLRFCVVHLERFPFLEQIVGRLKVLLPELVPVRAELLFSNRELSPLEPFEGLGVELWVKGGHMPSWMSLCCNAT